MTLLGDRFQISDRTPLPTQDISSATKKLSITGESISFVDGVAGTTQQIKLDYDSIMSSTGDRIGNEGDTSLVFTTGTILNTEIPWKFKNTAGKDTDTDRLATLADGEYMVDYSNGYILGKNADTTSSTTDTVTYNVRVGGVTITGGAGDASAANQTSEINLLTTIDADTGDILADTATIAGDTTSIDGKTPSIGTAVMTGSTPVTLATDDAAVTALQIIDDFAYAEDSVFASGSNVLLAGVEIDDPTALAAMTEGDVGNLKGDLSGRLITSDGTLQAGEDLTNDVMQVVQKPLAVSTYTLTRDSSAALEASSISKASAGNLYRSFGVIDATAPTDIYYILHLDSATLTADGAVTHLITPIPVVHVNGTDSSFDTGNFDFGVAAANGVVIVLSTTMVTKTISGSYLFATTLTY